MHDPDELDDPGGVSALRAAGTGNKRNLPCPICGASNRLTPKEKALGYQCDSCADRVILAMTEMKKGKGY